MSNIIWVRVTGRGIDDVRIVKVMPKDRFQFESNLGNSLSYKVYYEGKTFRISRKSKSSLTFRIKMCIC